MQSFCEFVEADNSDLEADIVNGLIVEMRAVLGADYEFFCQQLLCNEELRLFLESYLEHRRNWVGTASPNDALA